MDGTEEVGSDFVIREKFTDGEPGEKGTPSKDTTSHTETQQGAKESLTPGVVVQAGDVFGEVVKVTPKTVLVKLDGEEKEKRFKKEEVEVIG